MQTQVLIADDAMFMRKVIRKHLAECGMTDIVEAANGAEAVELFIKNRPGLVLMDITMPEMTGLEALEEILKTDPEAKVIMCSAIGQQSMIIKSLEMGAMGFIVKPLEKNEFEATIRSVIGQPEN
ncbi:MAG: response regulator [[Clostridium] scindens]